MRAFDGLRNCLVAGQGWRADSLIVDLDWARRVGLTSAQGGATMDLTALLFQLLPFLKRDREDKVVNDQYLDASGIRKAANSQGFDLVWSKVEKAPSRFLEGYEYCYDKGLWQRRKLVDGRGSIVLKRPQL